MSAASPTFVLHAPKDALWCDTTDELVYRIALSHRVALRSPDGSQRFYQDHAAGTEVSALALGSYRGVVVASAAGDDGITHVWRSAELQTVAVLQRPEASGPVVSLCFSADDDLLLVLEQPSQPVLSLWGWRGGQCLSSVQAHAEPARVALAVGPTLFMSASAAAVRFWRLESEGGGAEALQPVVTRGGGAACALALDAAQRGGGDGACITGDDGGMLKLWSAAEGQLIVRQAAHHGAVRALCRCATPPSAPPPAPPAPPPCPRRPR